MENNIAALNTPKTISRKLRSITIGWENVFPEHNTNYTYFLEICDDHSGTRQWKQVYSGEELQCTVINLTPCYRYDFKLKARCGENESDLILFQEHTETEFYFPRHMSYAIKHKKIAAIRKIVSWSLDLLELENIEDKTPLMQASENGDLDIVKLLVGLGAKINKPSGLLNRTALMMCAISNHVEPAGYLLEKKADKEECDNLGNTAIHLAITMNSYEFIKFALENDFNVNAVNLRGRTPLFISPAFASDDTIKLLHKTADYTIKDNDGRTFLQQLKIYKRLNLCELIKDFDITEASDNLGFNPQILFQPIEF